MIKQSFLLGLFILILSCWGCTKKEKTYTRQEMQRIVDSMVQQRAKELKQQAKTDLELRLPIEIKPKLDSLLHQTISIDTPPKMDTFGNGSVLPLDSGTTSTPVIPQRKK